MELIYWHELKAEPKLSPMWYVWYKEPLSIVITLFDVCDSEEKAEQAIADHKAGTHGTQFWPE